jgi:hypothetical protein
VGVICAAVRVNVTLCSRHVPSNRPATVVAVALIYADLT